MRYYSSVIGVGVLIRFAHLARLFPWLVTLAGASVRSEAAERREVAYRASAGCPGVEHFEEQVAARTRPERSAALPREVRLVEVEALAAGARGRVVLSGTSHETTREIRAATCAEAVEALALIVAILLDPEADTRPHVTRRSEPAAIAPSEPPKAEPRRTVYFGAGVDWSVVGGVAPGLLLGPRAFFEIGRAPPEPWFPSLRLSWLRAASDSVVPEGGGVAAFRLDAARVDGCVLRWSNEVASVEPCVGLEAGMLTAESTHFAGFRSQTLGWAAASGLARGVLRYADILTVHADLGVGIPLTRYRFRFSGQAPLHTSAALGGRVAVGVGVRFP